MATVDAARNLLLGILALQNSLIEQADLLAAFQFWSRDKSRSLAQVLVDRAALTEEDRVMLEGLVRRHLEKHGSDPEQSLAAVGPLSIVREHLERLADVELHATLAHLSANGATVLDPEATASLGVGDPTLTGGRFRVLRPHAKGGIGMVSVALDAELHREVALKEILPEQADDPASRARFLLEAELTGRLEHPGVVPVYGLGAGASGRPYYAMRFVRGESLKDAIEAFHRADEAPRRDSSERVIALRGLLGRFVDVCNAIAYAHSRGVVHRDIKPANILLGPYGETLVVDWGLAKVVGRSEPPPAAAEATLRPTTRSGSSETQAGTCVGTPAYMAPEQAEGRLQDIGPATDVYNLGATLYALLTGKPPVIGSEVVEVLRRVQLGEILPPRQVNRSVPPALQAVCLKAMALRPADRYGSPEALAAEVEHWMADEPVAAYREPVPMRLARWGRRHRSLVTGAAALSITAIAALVTGLVLLGQAGARTEQQRRRAEANFAEADRQRDLARDNFQIARRAVEDYFVQVSQNTLLKSPGHDLLRKQLLESGVKYYKEFVQRGGDDPGLQAEMAQAYFRVGSITADIGTPADALAAFNRARDLYQALSRVNPQDASFRGELARTHRQIGRMEARSQHREESIASFRRAIALGEELAARHLGVPDYRNDLAWGYNNVGSMLGRDGQLVAARRYYERAITTWENLIGEYPRDEFRIGLGQGYSNLAWNFCMVGRLDEAIKTTKKAVVVTEEVVRGDRGFGSKLCHALDNLGNAYFFAGQLDQSREAYQRALADIVTLARESPAVNEYQEIAIAIQNDLGHLLLRTNHDAEARALFNSALERAKTLPDASSLYFSCAYMYRGLGKLHRKERRTAAALEALQEAVRIGETNPGETPYCMYELACARALCSVVVGEGKSEPTAAGQAHQRRYADQAMDALQLAVANGWRNTPWMKVDPDLDTLRSREDFKKLRAELEKTQESLD